MTESTPDESRTPSRPVGDELMQAEDADVETGSADRAPAGAEGGASAPRSTDPLDPSPIADPDLDPDA